MTKSETEKIKKGGGFQEPEVEYGTKRGRQKAKGSNKASTDIHAK